MYQAVSTQLRDALHELYRDRAAIRGLAMAAGIDLGRAPATSNAGHSLDDVLREADREPMALPRLVRAALGGHSDHPGLQAAAQQPLRSETPWECPDEVRFPVMSPAVTDVGGASAGDPSSISIGRLRAAAVGLIEIPMARGWASASGVLLANDLFVTHRHVLRMANKAIRARVVFNYEAGETGALAGEVAYRCDPDRLFLTSESADLTVIALAGEPTLRWGSIPWRDAEAHVGDVLSWVGHPDGQTRTISRWRSVVTGMRDDRLHVLTTGPLAASGIALFNSGWQLVGLLRSGALLPSGAADAPGYRNEAVSVRALAGLIPEALQQ